MKIIQALMATAFLAAGAVCAHADEPGPDVIVRRTHVRTHVHKHIGVKTVAIQRPSATALCCFPAR
jgi:hypothetical protein